MDLYKGYVRTKDKQCLQKFKDAELLTLDDVRDLDEYAGILAEDTILIDLDDGNQAETLMNIIEDMQIDCKVIDTARGKHFLFRNSSVDRCYTHTKLACGLTADIKVGRKSSYEILKFNGEERFCEWDSDNYIELPRWLEPIKSSADFVDMVPGDGRNSSLFGYILTLQSAGFTKEESRETIRIINKYILKEPLSESELDTVLRDEAFQKDIFFQKGTFLHDVFARFLLSQFNIKRINGQLHCFDGKIYVPGYRQIEQKMVSVIPNLKAQQRAEVLKLLEIITPDMTEGDDVDLIAFENCLVNLHTFETHPFSDSYLITNIIPWEWNPDAYSEIADKTLNKLSCHNAEIRALLEECIGYCFYRRQEKSVSFLLSGSGSNGKSTYLDMVKNVLGRDNYVALDLEELSEKFSTASMFGKLANIGDDISDDFLQGKSISTFKKLVSGNDIKGENKGQDVFFFKPTTKLIFSANEIPRMRSKGFYAIRRRLAIIPFNARFSKDDPDYDSEIVWKLKSKETAEYLILLGMRALKRIIDTDGFTKCSLVEREMDEFERDNNPIMVFLEDVDRDEIIGRSTKTVFARYDVFCEENGYQKMSLQGFSREICHRLDCITKQIRSRDSRERIFCYE